MMKSKPSSSPTALSPPEAARLIRDLRFLSAATGWSRAQLNRALALAPRSRLVDRLLADGDAASGASRALYEKTRLVRTAVLRERPWLAEHPAAWPGRATDGDEPCGDGEPRYGAYPARVRDTADPDGVGRVLVSLPAFDGDYVPSIPIDKSDLPDGCQVWARLATLHAGQDRGSWFRPEIDDEVLVVFAGGDVNHAYVIGSLWNYRGGPSPQMVGSASNDLKQIRTRSGVRITLDDSSGKESLTLETPAGQRVRLRGDPATLELRDGNGNEVRLEATGISISSAAKVTVTGAGIVEVAAPKVTLSAAMVQASGIVQCDTLMANSVVSASYTPGAGNLW